MSWWIASVLLIIAGIYFGINWLKDLGLIMLIGPFVIAFAILVIVGIIILILIIRELVR